MASCSWGTCILYHRSFTDAMTANHTCLPSMWAGVHKTLPAWGQASQWYGSRCIYERTEPDVDSRTMIRKPSMENVAGAICRDQRSMIFVAGSRSVPGGDGVLSRGSIIPIEPYGRKTSLIHSSKSRGRMLVETASRQTISIILLIWLYII